MSEDKPQINGWSPPLVNKGWGESRIATQADVDELERIAAAYGQVRRLLKDLQEVLKSLP